MNGKKACYFIDNFQYIPVDKMGEGVINILGLLVDLCVAEDKLFIIEELENDLHPKALKELLKLIINASEKNQFIITTHSNIVTRYLGSEKTTKIIKVEMKIANNIPTSTTEEVGQDHVERRILLENLGYELSDMDIYNAWLFLEEASAETIIKKYLIPWFTPSLINKLRTFSARTVDEVRVKFDDFNRLFAYLNNQPVYVNRAWIIVDEGEKEKEIISKLIETYQGSGWGEEHFSQFKEHDFEKYYPDEFKERVDEVLSITNRKEKWNRKIQLLQQVEEWILNNEEEAKEAFKVSAKEVVEKLSDIADKLTNGGE